MVMAQFAPCMDILCERELSFDAISYGISVTRVSGDLSLKGAQLK